MLGNYSNSPTASFLLSTFFREYELRLGLPKERRIVCKCKIPISHFTHNNNYSSFKSKNIVVLCSALILFNIICLFTAINFVIKANQLKLHTCLHG